MIRVFIGYDPRQAVAFSVLSHTINELASESVSITPLCLPQLRHIHTREHHCLQTTDFSFTRFLTPYLSEYEGWSIYMDCDMIFREDISRLWQLRCDDYAVQVVKKQYSPQQHLKFLGMPQSRYSKKNWSSLMLFNNEKCRVLTPRFVNQADGLTLHQFDWLGSEELVGALPDTWNHIANYDEYDRDAAVVHFTEGGPYFNDAKHGDYADEWFMAHQRVQQCQQRKQASPKIVDSVQI